ncbi:DUF5994 family protein [Streptomyces sp. MAR4 CNY-716]
MTTTTLLPLMREDQFPALPLRLSLASTGSAPALLEGAWWPRSRDLAAELPALIAVLDPLWGRITRLAVNSTHWQVMPRKIPVGGHVVKVGWFAAELDPHNVLLRSFSTGRWDLLVIPPQTPPETAAWLMAAAADPLHARTASQLMQEAEHRRYAADGDRAQQAIWDSEGGRAARPSYPPSRAGADTRVQLLTKAR